MSAYHGAKIKVKFTLYTRESAPKLIELSLFGPTPSPHHGYYGAFSLSREAAFDLAHELIIAAHGLGRP